MTVKDIFSAALSLMFEPEGNSESFAPYALPFLNLLLPELFDQENELRKAQGKELLAAIPQLKTLDDTVPYDDRLTRGALPYGLAAKLVLDDNDMGKVVYFEQHYVNSVNALAKAAPETVVDQY